MPGNDGKGLLLAFVAALISGVSVFVNGAAVKLSDPVIYTTLKNTGALVFLAAIVFAFSELRYFRGLTRKQWAMLVLVGIIGGSVPFMMFFWGLKLGGAAVSSFLYRSLFIFAGAAGFLLLREKPSVRDLAAGLVMLAGNALLVSGALVFGAGQLLVLGATALWATEYTLSRKLMADIHPRVVMVSRMLFGSLVLFASLGMNGSAGSIVTVDAGMLLWLFVTSSLLCGFIMSWYSSLKHLPVFTASSILALGGIVTAVLDSAFLGKAFSLADAFGLLLILIGVAAMVGISRLVASFSKAKEALPGLVR
ncbi:MAG: DMT family transporter [Candidatus Micrarchaeia archaeon]